MNDSADLVISLSTAVFLLALILVVGVIIVCICFSGVILTYVLCKSTCKDLKNV